MLSADQIAKIMPRAETLARQTAAAEVRDEQLSLVLVHLKRHRNVAATLALLGELKRSSFARRSKQTPAQFAALDEHVGRALQGISAWDKAAAIVGWARRLVTFYQPRNAGRPNAGGFRGYPGGRR